MGCTCSENRLRKSCAPLPLHFYGIRCEDDVGATRSPLRWNRSRRISRYAKAQLPTLLPRARKFISYNPLTYQPNACWQAAGLLEQSRIRPTHSSTTRSSMPGVARPDRPGQGAFFQREDDHPPLLRPRDPPPLDAGPAPAARTAGPASSCRAICAALQPPRAAWACVLCLLCGWRCRSKVEVSIVVEDNASDVPAWSSMSAPARQTIAWALEKLQSAHQKSGIDRATTLPTAEG